MKAAVGSCLTAQPDLSARHDSPIRVLQAQPRCRRQAQSANGDFDLDVLQEPKEIGKTHQPSTRIICLLRASKVRLHVG